MNDKNIQIDYNMGTATFLINEEGSASKTTYKGVFKVKCVMSPLEYINSDALYRELLGKVNPQLASKYISELCYTISQLKYRVMDVPSWYKNTSTGIDGSHIDDNVLFSILDKATEAEMEYRRGIEEKYKKARDEVKKAVDEKTLTDGEEEEKSEE
jgi:hypothetical protein